LSNLALFFARIHQQAQGIFENRWLYHPIERPTPWGDRTISMDRPLRWPRSNLQKRNPRSVGMRARIPEQEYCRFSLPDCVLRRTIIASQCWRVQHSLFQKRKKRVNAVSGCFPTRSAPILHLFCTYARITRDVLRGAAKVAARVPNKGRTSRFSGLSSCRYLSVMGASSTFVELTEWIWT
jgi:hypothetical protein